MLGDGELRFDQVDKWYESGYQDAYHRGFIGWVYQQVYLFMEKPHRGKAPAAILEVGAGEGDYRTQANPSYSRYVELDLRSMPNSKTESGVEKLVGDAQDLSMFSEGSFDRLVATCVLAHLDSPLTALSEWRRVVKPGGSLSIYVPPEAGLLVRWVRKLVTWRAPVAAGFDARRIASLQHKFSYFYLDALIQEIFSGDVVRRRTFPSRFLEFDLALFHIYEIKISP